MEDNSSILERITQAAQRIQQQPGIGGLPLALAELDRDAWRLGRSWLERRGLAGFAVGQAANPTDLDVYVATHVYSIGGHTALIGDFVEARHKAGGKAKLVLTGGKFQSAAEIPNAIRSRTGIGVDDIHIVRGATQADRLDDLFEHLLALKPRRLFLFHHAFDPLPVSIAQPEISAQTILVHHTDATPTLGLCIPGITIIELNPTAAALSRAQNRSADLLLLTCPDPGPRPYGFLTSDGLVTGSSGSASKFNADYFYSYAEMVAAVLRETQGTHVHIGPLSAAKLARINRALVAARVDQDRFVHRAEVASVSRALWDFRCDVYIASFPMDGARTMIEVAASGIPYVSHTRRPASSIKPRVLELPGARSWRTLDDLVDLLHSFTDRAVLEDMSAQIRGGYERQFRPEVFADTLERILKGQGGFDDPDWLARNETALNTLAGSLTRAEMFTHHSTTTEVASEIRRSIEALGVDVDAVASMARSEAEAASDHIRRMESSLLRLMEVIHHRDENIIRESAKAEARNQRVTDDLRKLKAKLRRQRRGGLFRRLLGGRR